MPVFLTSNMWHQILSWWLRGGLLQVLSFAPLPPLKVQSTHHDFHIHIHVITKIFKKVCVAIHKWQDGI